jgi:lipopolysaccharide exporter
MRRAIAKGAAWMLLARAAERCLGLVSLLILARVLVPADFGLVAMAMSVIVFVELASTFGFDLALIHREHVTREHYDTAWTLQVAFGLLCAVIIAVLAYPGARFYDEPRLIPIMLVLALSRLVQSFENIGTVDFRRQMDFSREFAFSAGKKVTGFVITIPLAVMFESYWALIAGATAGRFAGVILSYAMQPYRPRFSLAARDDVFSFSGWIFVVGLASFASQRSSHFVVGRQLGPAALGLYTVGSEIALLPVTDLMAPINRAVFPGFSRMTADPALLRQGFVDILGVIWIFALPASFGIAAVAQPLVLTMLGSKWEDAVIVVQILALAGAMHAATSNHYSAWLALGKTRVTALMETLHFVILLPLLLLLSRTLGIVGVAYAEFLATTVTVFVECWLISRAFALSRSAYLAGLWRPLIAAATMAIGVTMLLRELNADAFAGRPLLQLAIVVPAGIAAYGSALTILWLLWGRPRGAESFLLARLTEVFRASRPIWQRRSP